LATIVPFLLVPSDDHETADRRALGIESVVDAALDARPGWDRVAVVGADLRAAIVEAELADILVYLVRIADRLGVDLLAATGRKLAENARKYPAERVRGKALKYDEYD